MSQPKLYRIDLGQMKREPNRTALSTPHKMTEPNSLSCVRVRSFSLFYYGKHLKNDRPTSFVPSLTFNVVKVRPAIYLWEAPGETYLMGPSLQSLRRGAIT